MGQALSLLNGDVLNGKIRSDRGAVAKAVASGARDDAIFDRLFLAALTRRPTDAERARIREALAGIKDLKERRAAIEDLYWATLTSKEFLFNH